ncbi:hypothetical protein Tel_05775 [Candidatus Tenderia electrophaga]|jgi:chemotaxis protein CheZ|uniref:Protein phosphatase CheZ n=1 Tax=Candidatus Tenderia electrophaga TaxID=1748243 RepID=A0A0S2TC32_9GAMM|nr:hypothetical protein Tel_05775 [Candidatus Tenderia electrophaga]
MIQNQICSDQGLEYAKKLLECIEQGRAEEAEQVLEDISALRESELFQELGKLTRDLHDSLMSFQLDPKMADMAQKDIPDAKERLNHVITMTEDAADKTLTAVEGSLKQFDELREKATRLQTNWVRFRKRDMDVDEFRAMSAEIDEFFKWLDDKGSAINAGLSDIMMAQDFQDLTGQIIRRVITLVQDVEDGLVSLIRMTGHKMHTEEQGQGKQEKQKQGPDIEAVGPAVPGVDQADVVNGQDDVDDLLSSLGF